MNYPYYILGAPFLRARRKQFEVATLERFGGDYERAVLYMDKVTDSQMNKASGLLSSVSILAGMSYFVEAHTSLVLALASIVIVVSTLYVPWPLSQAASVAAESEFKSLCRRSYYRAICNRLGISLIILTVVFLIPFVFTY
ncbi:MAG: hypothetical protein JWO73_956 [Candidatus Taylorbacteria bacterium]|nr:hypothetical protein [Candidatus Taylorbacteria bacterium]